MYSTNSNFQKLEYLTEDALFQRLEQYQLRAESFGHLRSRESNTTHNAVLPFHRIIYVTQGPITYTINQQSVMLKRGDVLYTPASTVYNARGNRPEDIPELLYLHFSVLPHHLTQNFVRVLGAGGEVSVFRVSHSEVEFYFHAIMKEYENRRPGYYKGIHSYLRMILMELIRDHYNRGTAGSRTTAYRSDSVLNMTTNYIAGNLNQTIRVEELSRICGASETYLYKLFKSALSLSPQEYILNCRMEYGAQLLRDSHMIITQIAQELAFSGFNHFSNSFYCIIGIHPTTYRKSGQPDS